MTSETRTLIEISDIEGIEIECRECKATIHYPVAKNFDKISSKCPNCNSDLFILTQRAGAPANSQSVQTLLSLIKVIKHFENSAADQNSNIRLRLANERKVSA